MKKRDIKQQIRKIITEEFIIESMNVQIDGVKYDRLDNLHDLAFHLIDRVIGPIVTKLPPDQVAYFRKNGVQYYETIVPDGSYSYEKGEPTGILNLYISGLMAQPLQLVLKNIFAELRRLGIKWGPLKKEQSGTYKSQVIRIPIVKNDQKYSGPPEMNMSNVNAYQIFHNILQYEGEYEFTMEAQELKDRIESLAGDKGWIGKHTIKPFDTKMEPEEPEDQWKHADDTPPDTDDPNHNPHNDVINKLSGGLGARLISMGLNEDDIKRRLGHIWEIADWAIKHGHTKMYVA